MNSYFISPLEIQVPGKRKKFILNLNNYRNMHFQTLNHAKINYKNFMQQQFSGLGLINKKIHIEYVLYPKTARITDIANVVSIHAKFFCDALVSAGIVHDDNYNFISSSSERFGHIDRVNPRVDIFITEQK